jgi:carbamoyltransferase
MVIVGISAFQHDSAASIVVGGEIMGTAQEDRIMRKKHDAVFRLNAIGYCLEEAGVGRGSVDYVVFYDAPLIKFECLLETCLAYVLRGFHLFIMAIPVWLKGKQFQSFSEGDMA